MPKPYSYDLRKRVIKCFKEGIKYQDIADNFDLSLSTIKRYSSAYKKTGDLRVKNLVKTGRKAKIEDLNKLKNFVKENNNLSLIDMANKLTVSKSALHRSIIKSNFSFKKSRGYILNEKEEKRKEFIERIKFLTQEDIFYLDESGFDIDMQKQYGYWNKSERFYSKNQGVGRIKEYRLLQLETASIKCFILFILKAQPIKKFLKLILTEILLPNLPKNSYLIMDNAAFHKGEEIENLIKSANINLIYLPTYSPDLNPIEKKWAQVKSCYRKLSYYFEDKIKLIEMVLLEQKVSTV